MEETRAADEANADVIETAYEPPKPNEPALNKYFKACIKMKVSDLHLKAGQPAYVRHKGDLRAMTGGPLSDEFIKAGIMELLSEEQKELYHKMGAIDFAHDVGPAGDADRFRVNAYLQRGKLSVAARRVDRNILSFEQLYLPETMAQIAEFEQEARRFRQFPEYAARVGALGLEPDEPAFVAKGRLAALCVSRRRGRGRGLCGRRRRGVRGIRPTPRRCRPQSEEPRPQGPLHSRASAARH